MNTKKNAFTLVELIVAILISSIILIGILIFLWDTMENIASSKANTRNLIAFSEFQNKLNSYKNIYSSWYILVDNNSNSWSDIFIMKNNNNDDWILISRIDLDTKKIIEDNKIYKYTPLWIRRISKQEINDINSNTWVIYDYKFQSDKIFYDLNLKDFQITSFNSGSINEFKLIINPYYLDRFNWTEWKEIPTKDLLNINIDF